METCDTDSTLRWESDLFRVPNGIRTVLFENFHVFLIHTDRTAFLILVENGFIPQLYHFFFAIINLNFDAF